MDYDRPGGWLGGYGSGSPIHERGGPLSPKKRVTSWIKAKEELEKEDNPVVEPKLKPMPVMDGSSSEEVEEEIVEEVIEVEESTEEEEEEEEMEEVFEVVESEEEEVSEGSEFEDLPPPIEIPNALKPVHLRQPEPTKKADDSSSDDDSSSSDDSTDARPVVRRIPPVKQVDSDSDSSDSSDEEDVKEARKPSPPSMRPSVVRGHSYDSDNLATETNADKRGGRRPEREESHDSDDVAEAPRAAVPAGRPGTIRGHSFDSDDGVAEEMKNGRRAGGRKPDRQDSHDSFDDIPEAPRASVPAGRPGMIRGHSFDSDDGVAEDMQGGRRSGGRKPSRSDADDDDEDDAPHEVSELRPGTVRGHSFDSEEGLPPEMRAARRAGAKKPESKAIAQTPAPAPAPTRRADDEDSVKEYGWEKPEWTKQRSLRSTGKAEKLMEGKLEAPITTIAQTVADEKQEIGFQKPDWTKNKALRPSAQSEVLKTKGDLAKPITSLPHQKPDGPFEKPEWTASAPVKPTIATGEKDISWQKPDWATGIKLRGTKKGEKLKSGADIARPIGGIKPSDA